MKKKKVAKKRKPKVIKVEKDLVKKVYKELRNGKRPDEIYADMLLVLQEKAITEKQWSKTLEEAYHYLENDLHKDREFIFQLHMGRYEQAYEDLIKMERKDGTPLNPKYDWLQMKTRYRAALSNMRSKEDLIGVHDKSIVLEINQGKVVVGEQVNISGPHIGGFNLDRLSLDECVELLGLIQEARTVPIEGVQRVTIKTTRIEINGNMVQQTQQYDNPEIQDITYEEMPENVVEKMIETKIEPIEDEEAPSNIIDARPANLPKPKNLDEVQQTHNKKLLSQFKNRLNRS
jgi:hypothetical protein